MILSCNSCEKKFVVPDNAITPSGRLVQCSSCGNKWKQFPTKPREEMPKQDFKKIIPPKKIIRSNKAKKNIVKKKTGPTLYSPEYLSKKHGINIDGKSSNKQRNIENKAKVNFGFYNFLILFFVITVFSLKTLYFSQEILVEYFPISEIYINYLFENLNNIKEVIKNLVISY
tara:strand:+ start:63 stop:578 length:516 start_codon:yes stop_codon:yes gene_type:complete